MLDVIMITIFIRIYTEDTCRCRLVTEVNVNKNFKGNQNKLKKNQYVYACISNKLTIFFIAVIKQLT